jgi:hypothetical protein
LRKSYKRKERGKYQPAGRVVEGSAGKKSFRSIVPAEYFKGAVEVFNKGGTAVQPVTAVIVAGISY